MALGQGYAPPIMLDLTQWAEAESLEDVYRDLGLASWIPGKLLPGGIRPLDGQEGVFLLDQTVDAEGHRGEQVRRVGQAVGQASRRGGILVVRVSGDASPILQDLVSAGAGCIEGICCPPQGDELIMHALCRIQGDTLLWGGLPRACMLESWPDKAFRRIAKYIAESACGEKQVMIGVAGGVPAEAPYERIRYLADLFRHLEDII